MEQSPEDIRQEHLYLMGPELGAEYNALWKEVAWLHMKWNLYVQLYAHSQERFALLKQVAPHFFWMIQLSLLDDTISHMARLTDPRTKDTLTLRRLPKLTSDGRLASQLQKLVKIASDASGPAKDWRDKVVAHRDRAIALGASPDLLHPDSADLEAALSAITDVVHRLETYHRRSKTAFQYVSPGSGGGADSLVFYLCKGVRAEEARMERFSQGKPLPEDLKA